MTPRDRMKERIGEAFITCKFETNNPVIHGYSPPHELDLDKLADRVLADAREILGVEALETQLHDLTEEFENYKAALRERWSSFLPKEGE